MFAMSARMEIAHVWTYIHYILHRARCIHGMPIVRGSASSGDSIDGPATRPAPDKNKTTTAHDTNLISLLIAVDRSLRFVLR